METVEGVVVAVGVLSIAALVVVGISHQTQVEEAL
jgi:hypothetical protein